MSILPPFLRHETLQSPPVDPENGGQPSPRIRSPQFSPDIRWTLWFFAAFGLEGMLGLYLGTTGKRPPIATAMLWALACFISGGGIGFLFGIPKILQGNPPAPAPGAAGGGTAAESAAAYRQQVNTNLTEISDWLTKIIVGLGLVNLGKVPGLLATTAAVLGAGLGTKAEPLAYGIIVSFAVSGFLFGYLSTRLFLAGAFSRADRAANEAQDRVEAELAQIRIRQDVIDAGRSATLAPAAGEEGRGSQGERKTTGGHSSEQDPAQNVQRLRQLAEDYFDFDDPDYAVRLRQKNLRAAEMAELAQSGGVSKPAIAAAASGRALEGMALTLATLVVSSPEPGDAALLFQMADHVRRLHVRYRLVLALLALLNAGLLGQEDRGKFRRLLRSYRSRADESLSRLIDHAETQLGRNDTPA